MSVHAAAEVGTTAAPARLDCRSIEPTEHGFLQELAGAVGGEAATAEEQFEQFEIFTAAEVDIDTFAQRYVGELATSGAVHSLPPIVRAWTRLPNA
jgi:hypothetical protein